MKKAHYTYSRSSGGANIGGGKEGKGEDELHGCRRRRGREIAVVDWEGAVVDRMRFEFMRRKSERRKYNDFYHVEHKQKQSESMSTTTNFFGFDHRCEVCFVHRFACQKELHRNCKAFPLPDDRTEKICECETSPWNSPEID